MGFLLSFSITIGYVCLRISYRQYLTQYNIIVLRLATLFLISFVVTYFLYENKLYSRILGGVGYIMVFYGSTILIDTRAKIKIERKISFKDYFEISIIFIYSFLLGIYFSN